MNSKYITIGALVVALVLAATAAFAQGGPRPGNRDRGPENRGPRPVFGELIAIDGDSWTIAPQIPEFIEDRMEERGRELPDEITVSITDRTWFTYAGEDASAADFAVGDMIVVVPRRTKDGPVAIHVADAESAKEFIGQRMRELQGDGGPGMGQGPGGQGLGRGPAGDRGRQADRGPRPAFGVITAIDGDSLTIEPEVPAFVAERMEEHGRDLPELPDELTVLIGERTRFMVDGEPVDGLPFAVGDHLAVMGGLGGQHPAFAIADYATVEQHMEEGSGPRGPGNGQGPPPGGKQGNQGPQGNKGPRNGPRR
jgi:hypothetical protein